MPQARFRSSLKKHETSSPINLHKEPFFLYICAEQNSNFKIKNLFLLIREDENSRTEN